MKNIVLVYLLGTLGVGVCATPIAIVGNKMLENSSFENVAQAEESNADLEEIQDEEVAEEQESETTDESVSENQDNIENSSESNNVETENTSNTRSANNKGNNTKTNSSSKASVSSSSKPSRPTTSTNNGGGTSANKPAPSQPSTPAPNPSQKPNKPSGPTKVGTPTGQKVSQILNDFNYEQLGWELIGILNTYQFDILNSKFIETEKDGIFYRVYWGDNTIYKL